jgi:hypothetical protein
MDEPVLEEGTPEFGRFKELLESVAGLKAVRDGVKRLEIPVLPDTTEDRRKSRAEMAELRTFVPDKRKLRKLIAWAAREMRSRSSEPF